MQMSSHKVRWLACLPGDSHICRLAREGFSLGTAWWVYSPDSGAALFVTQVSLSMLSRQDRFWPEPKPSCVDWCVSTFHKEGQDCTMCTHLD